MALNENVSKVSSSQKQTNEQPKQKNQLINKLKEGYARESEEEYNPWLNSNAKLKKKPSTPTEQPAQHQTGWNENGMVLYNTDSSCGMAQNNGSWYYLSSNGTMATGWLKQ